MRKIVPLLLFCALFIQPAFSQQPDADAKARNIPEASCASVETLASYIKNEFPSDSARIRAIYVWIGTHIKYDVPRLKARMNDPYAQPQAVPDVLNSRAAVCQGYSELFAELCKALDIPAVVISGYTKLNGRVSSIGHAWVAAKTGGDWQLFDPTWGAGYVKNDKFEFAFNDRFYKVPPAALVADHMPFDPMYQFLPNPVSHKEFIEGSPVSNKPLFNFRDSIEQYEKLTRTEQRAAELTRLEAAGVHSDLLMKRKRYLTNALQAKASANAFEEGGRLFKAGIALFNEYVAHKNRQFSGIGEEGLRSLMDSIENSMKDARAALMEAEPKTPQQREAKNGNISNIDRFWTRLIKEKMFLTEYFGRDASGRKLLFAKNSGQ